MIKNPQTNPAEYEPLSDAVKATSQIVQIIEKSPTDSIGRVRIKKIRKINLTFLYSRAKTIIDLPTFERMIRTIKNIELQG